MKNYSISFSEPAGNFNEALPVGNGRLGAMVYGKVYTELIGLNEDSVWFGGKRDRNNPDALKNLEKIRDYIFAGEIGKAQDLCGLALSGIPEEQRHYEPLGNLYIQFAGKKGTIENYRRELSLNDAISTVSYTRDGVKFTRKVFASFPKGLLVVRIEADRKGAVSFRTQIARGGATWDYGPFEEQVYRNPGYNGNVDETRNLSDDMTLMTASTGCNGVKLSCVIKVINEGGTREGIGNTIIVDGADSATILLAADTDYRESEPLKSALSRIAEGAQCSYEELLSEHLEDYKSLFERVSLDLCGHEKIEYKATLKKTVCDEGLPGEYVEDKDSDNELKALPELFFHFGRYLMIEGSRPGSLPLNLQGVWNDSFGPMWGSKYTININAQMNYWPALVCNLSECHLPLIDLFEGLRENGTRTAQVMYGCRGFMAHHNTDLWCDTAPQDVCLSSTYWVMGAAWLALHVWDHFLFTKEKDFLGEHYPSMKEAARFVLDYLVEDRSAGADVNENCEKYLVTCPTISPENEYVLPNGEKGVVCKGASMDNQIIRELFTACIKAEDILYKDKKDSEFTDKLMETLKRIAPIKIGKYGQIMEWNEDYEETDPGHRHISHLFALYPGRQISVDKTPELAKAARVTLNRRLSAGGGHTGWSRAWIINMWARLEDGEESYKNVVALLQKSTLPNLFDNHPPFQIDGNFGGCAAIAEMLVYSDEDKVKLLPALPKAWSEGSLTGFCTRDGRTIKKLSWKDGKVTEISYE